MNDLTHISFVGIETREKRAGGITASVKNATPTGRLPRAARVTVTDSHDPFVAWVLERAGLDSGAYRSSAMQRRLPACLRQLRAPCRDSARARLEHNPSLLSRALDSMLIGVSAFFRDREVFHALQHGVLPTLLLREPRLRILSVGASTGQEIYSVAMLLAETGALGRGELLGIDPRPSALDQARRGEFDRSDFGSDMPAWCERHLTSRPGGRCALSAELRAAVDWRAGDVLTSIPPGPWHVILFRNVSIYLEEHASARVWERLAEQLAPGGFLVTGKAERPLPSLGLRQVAPSIFQRLARPS